MPVSGGSSVLTTVFAAALLVSAQPGFAAEALTDLDDRQQHRFANGHRLFDKNWTPDEGLGPAYNETSCRACHADDGRRSGGLADDHKTLPSAVVRFGISPENDDDIAALKGHLINTLPEPGYRFQLQTRASSGTPPEGRFTLSYRVHEVTLAGGETTELREPQIHFDELINGPLQIGTMRSLRLGPTLHGIGLLEAVPETVILEWADPDDTDSDGISGRANRVWDNVEARVKLGRFGWKAGQPSLLQQTASALAIDLGITSAIFPYEDRPTTSSLPIEAGSPVELLADYLHLLAPPAQQNSTGLLIDAGRKLFNELGCSLCHRPNLTTGAGPNLPAAWQHRELAVYSDLLLHDMGPGLADRFIEGRADFWEWRTAPLWGIGAAEASGKPVLYLHDGRARSLLEAILWHGGEAEKARRRFISLEKSQRQSLLAFLRSL